MLSLNQENETLKSEIEKMNQKSNGHSSQNKDGQMLIQLQKDLGDMKKSYDILNDKYVALEEAKMALAVKLQVIRFLFFSLSFFFHLYVF